MRFPETDLPDIVYMEYLTGAHYIDKPDEVERYAAVFNGEGAQEEPLDAMMRFDFMTLLPALLQVEDRMSMAHGLETRVPLLDRPLVSNIGEGLPSLTPAV